MFHRVPKIALVTRAFNSGAGRFAAELAGGLAQQGADIVLIAPPFEPAELEPRHGVQRIKTPSGAISGSRLRAALSKMARLTANMRASILFSIANHRSAAVIFSIADHEIILIPTLAILRLLGASTILVVHDPIPHDLDQTSPSGRIRMLLIHLAFNLSKHLVVLTHEGRNKIKSQFHQPHAKISVIAHGSFDLPNRSTPPQTSTLLCFGSIRQNKRVLQVIEGIKRCRRQGLAVRLILTGDSGEGRPYVQECLKAIGDDPAGFDVRLNYVEDARLPDLFREIDAFLLAYDDFSSQSGVAVMAGLAARPVISTFAGGVSELRALGLCGVEIARPVTAEAVAEAVAQFVNAPADEWRKLADAGSATMAAALDWGNIAKQYLVLTDKLKTH